jgi:DNA topoisomerase VI subunit A
MKEKQLLIELYFLNQDLKKSEALTKELLFQDKENAIFYYQWLIRIAETQPDFFSTRKLYYSLKSWRTKSKKQQFEKNSLLQKLEQLIKLNPSFGTQFQEELNRQEFIEFPD